MKAAIATKATTNVHQSLQNPSGVDKKNKPKKNSTATNHPKAGVTLDGIGIPD